MARAVRFELCCPDTRVGLHVRVVGSSPALGAWDPQRGLPLQTSPVDFPTWHTEQDVIIEQGIQVEYKYVIFSSDGQAVRWEERENRTFHLAELVSQGVLSATGSVTIRESFSAHEVADQSFRIFTSGHEKACSGLRPTPSFMAMGDEIAPSMRERMPSNRLSGDSLVTQGMISNRSCSMLGSPLADDVFCPTMAVPEDRLVREVSSSSLFLGNVGNEEMIQPVRNVSEFEHKYQCVGDGPLGEGTFGLVWRCDPLAPTNQDTRERAAKIIRKARLQARDFKYLLGEDGEVNIHLTMKHPHIIELFEYFDEPGTVTLILEYCAGGDLFDAIVAESKNGRRGFCEQDAARVTQHLLSAVEYMHGEGVVHRDIKCENVLLARKNTAVSENVFKICDFGFAAHDRGGGLFDRLGSPDTVAPEVVLGYRYGKPVDLWSLGVLLFMMLSAHPPFFATSDNEVLRKVVAGSYSLRGGFWDGVSQPVKDMISSLIVVDPSKRVTASQSLQTEWLKQGRAEA